MLQGMSRIVPQNCKFWVVCEVAVGKWGLFTHKEAESPGKLCAFTVAGLMLSSCPMLDV